jgi:hypothetical protein
MDSEFWKWIEENFVLITGVAASIKWVWEYSETRKFEKNRFLLERIEHFNSQKSVQTVQKLLDWNRIAIDINGESKVIEDSFLAEALKAHDDKDQFTLTEMYIRQIFDDYFTHLSELIILSQTGLVDSRNLKKFMKYWIEILNGTKKNKPTKLVSTFSRYLSFYGYSEVLDFIQKKD